MATTSATFSSDTCLPVDPATLPPISFSPCSRLVLQFPFRIAHVGRFFEFLAVDGLHLLLA
ncbi:MAG: hypothetical protein MZU84_01500 [Sphingobacterium sp.]|nr:hypothetical protein [Sphingobacterium sp.]